MPDNNIDINAVVAQIDALKRQRSAAMDDVAVLFGQNDSLTKQVAELTAKLEAYRDTPKTENKPTPAEETAVGRSSD